MREWVRLAQAETLVLVGHEPGLSDLAAAVCGLKPGGLALKKTGALAIGIEPGAPPTSGRLLWLVPPKILRALPRRRKVES